MATANVQPTHQLMRKHQPECRDQVSDGLALAYKHTAKEM